MTKGELCRDETESAPTGYDRRFACLNRASWTKSAAHGLSFWPFGYHRVRFWESSEECRFKAILQHDQLIENREYVKNDQRNENQYAYNDDQCGIHVSCLILVAL